MGDSQSRYGIVASLTASKLELLDELSRIKKGADEAQQDAEFRKANLEKDKTAISENAKLQSARLTRQATDAYERAVREAAQEKDDLLAQAKDCIEQTARNVEKADRDLKQQEMKAKNLQTNLKVDTDSIQAKIAAIESALRDIQEISKTAPQN